MRFPKAPSPIPKAAGKPLRIKTYSAQTGFVYQYYFAGEGHAGGGRQYDFRVSTDRTAYFLLQIRLPGEVVNRWQEAQRRELSETECYAVAKMTLFRAFDAGIASAGQQVTVTGEDLASIAGELDLA